LAVVTASPRTWPLLICSSIALPPICRSTRPAIGTCVISIARDLLEQLARQVRHGPYPGRRERRGDAPALTVPRFDCAVCGSFALGISDVAEESSSTHAVEATRPCLSAFPRKRSSPIRM